MEGEVDYSTRGLRPPSLGGDKQAGPDGLEEFHSTFGAFGRVLPLHRRLSSPEGHYLVWVSVTLLPGRRKRAWMYLRGDRLPSGVQVSDVPGADPVNESKLEEGRGRKESLTRGQACLPSLMS